MCPSVLISAIKLRTAVPESLLGAAMIHSKPPQSGSLSAFNIPSHSDHFCHLHFLLVTLVACNAIALRGQDGTRLLCYPISSSTAYSPSENEL